MQKKDNSGLSTEAITYYLDRPVEFVEEQLFTEEARRIYPGIAVTWQQRELLQAVAHDKFVSCRSGHGIGKTSALSWIDLWFMATRPHPVCVITGPKFEHLKDTLGKEINKWLANSNLTYFLKSSSESVFNKYHQKTWYSVFRTAQKDQSLAGYHEDHLLIIIDEASGVGDDISGPLQGALTKDDNRMILTGNPTLISGFFYQSHTSDRTLWKCLNYNSEDSPIVHKDYCRRMESKYGKNSDVYRVRVLGEFPKGNPEAFIQLSDVEAAVTRTVDKGDFLEIGVDCARFGDDLTVICTRQGNHVYPLVTKEKTTIDEIVGLTLLTIRQYRKDTGIKSTVRVKVDVGGLGAGVVDYLNLNRTDNIEVLPCNFGGCGNDEYFDYASLMWGGFRDELQYISLPNDEWLTAELSTRHHKPVADGRTRIEPKSEYKKRHTSSPDRADAVILCFAKNADVQRVWPYYLSSNPKCHRKFDVRWPMINELNSGIYVALHMEQDYSIFGICALWCLATSKLFIYDEIIISNPLPEIIANEISMKAPRRDAVFGSDDFMRLGANNVQVIMSEWKIEIKAKDKYDDRTAILLTNELFKGSKITVHDKCVETDRQFREWSVKNGRPTGTYIGCCRALTYVIAELKERRIINERDPLRPYTKEREAFVSEFKQTGKMPSNKPPLDWRI